MNNLNYESSTFNELPLELSLCRYKYINKIINDPAIAGVVSKKYIYSLLQRSITDVNIDHDIILYNKELYLYCDKRQHILKSIFMRYVGEFKQEIKNIVYYPSVILKPENKISKLFVIASTTNYAKYATPLNISNKLLIRLIKLYFIVNTGKKPQMHIILNHIYHLMLLYKSIGVNWTQHHIEKYAILSSPTIKRQPFTYFSLFPFIERYFGSLGFYKTKILITANASIDLNILFSNYSYKDVIVIKYKDDTNIKLRIIK